MARGIPAVISDLQCKSPPELLQQIALSGKGDQHFQEDYLQSLIDDAPDLLPVRDFYPTATSLFSLGREIPVDLGGKEGYIDNLFVTNDAHLVLVETKLYRNPESVREVVAQTFQYGEAINSMTLMQLESRIRRGQKQGNQLRIDETIRARVEGLNEAGGVVGLVDDFEDRLETQLRAGEILYLIVADGIHASVERMTQWLNQIGRTAPYKFGLIELRFFKLSDGKTVVIPRTLLRTKEVSRHVIMVDVHGSGATVETTVTEQTRTSGGGTAITSKAIKASGPPLSAARLLAEAKARSAEAFAVISELLSALEPLGLDSREKSVTLQFGLIYPREDGEFFPLLSLESEKLYSQLPTALSLAIGDAAFVEHKRALNSLALFFRPEDVDDPKKRINALLPTYEALTGKVSRLVEAISSVRDKALAALTSGDEPIT